VAVNWGEHFIGAHSLLPYKCNRFMVSSLYAT
jgi:hypothetical protein